MSRKYDVSMRTLMRCLHTIQDHCTFATNWSGDDLTEFCSNRKNLAALYALRDSGAIHFMTNDNSEMPVFVVLLDGVPKISIENSEKWKDRIYGFICGVLTAVIAEAAIYMLCTLI